MANPVKCIRDYIEELEKLTPNADEELLYRGHSDESHKLLPSVLREARLKDKEHFLLHELVATHPSEFNNDWTTLEQLVRAQHYSLPTRLLDATWNPLVALFFSIGAIDSEIDGQVITITAKKDKVKFYDSDTVSCIANLAHLTKAEKDGIDFGLSVTDFNEQDSIKRLLHYIRSEKPHFEGKINASDLQTAICIKPKQSNQRIVVQDGAFILFGIIDELHSDPPKGLSFNRLTIDKDSKANISAQLAQIRINESKMFPEIENMAKYIAG